MKNKSLTFSTYDCFTKVRYGGNVGVIVWNAHSLNHDEMQKIAKEFNAPVTGFIIKQAINTVTARFFMPTSEIAMCGHVTIGIFSHLSKKQKERIKNYKLNIPAGKISVNVQLNDNDLPTVMFSSQLPKYKKINININNLLHALKMNKNDTFLQSKTHIFDAGLKHIFINIKESETIKSLSPNFEELTNLCKKNNIHTVACFSINKYKKNHITIRDFCPLLGVKETAASGTTNAALTGFLLYNKIIAPISQKIIFCQGQYIGRPSEIISDVKVKKNKIIDLKIGGSAIENFFGKIHN